MEIIEYTAMHNLKELKKCRNLAIVYGTFTTAMAGISLYSFTDPKFKVLFAGSFLVVTGIGAFESIYSQKQINIVMKSDQYKKELELEEKNKILDKQIEEYRERVYNKYFKNR